MARQTIGDLAPCAERFAGCLSEAMALSETGSAIWMLESIAGLAVMTANAAVAARLFGTADRHREESEMKRPFWDRIRYDADVEATKSTLGPAAFRREWNEGSDLSLQDAVAVALQVTDLVRQG